MLKPSLLIAITMAGLLLLAAVTGIPLSQAAAAQGSTGTPQGTTTLQATVAPQNTTTPPGTTTPPATPVQDPVANQILNEVTLVQHNYDPYDDYTWFNCASPGLGLMGVEPNPAGPIYVGPNAGDFDLWGVIGLFRVTPEGVITFVPQRPAEYFTNPEGTQIERLSLEQTLDLFAGGEAVWIGEHGQAGRIAACDPQYVTPTATPDDDTSDATPDDKGAGDGTPGDTGTPAATPDNGNGGNGSQG